MDDQYKTYGMPEKLRRPEIGWKFFLGMWVTLQMGRHAEQEGIGELGSDFLGLRGSVWVQSGVFG